jgi:hypothetical protein
MLSNNFGFRVLTQMVLMLVNLIVNVASLNERIKIDQYTNTQNHQKRVQQA